MDWPGECVLADEIDHTLSVMFESDFKMYVEQQDLDEELRREQERKRLAAGEDDRPRYFSVGYEANYDPPSDVEIALWQKHFPYISVVGEGLTEPAEEEDGIGGEEEDCEQSEPILLEPFPNNNNGSNLDLTVYGRKIEIGMLRVDPSDEDVSVAEEGILDEMIAIDCFDEQEMTESEGESERDLGIDAELREEKIKDTVQQVWPHIVPLLDPLVRRVYNAIRSENLPKDFWLREQAIFESRKDLQDDEESFGW